MSRFDQINAEAPEKSEEPKSYIPKCPLCQDHGFTGCPQAITNYGDLIAVAFEQGIACGCQWGAWFAENQMKWMEMA